MWPTCEFEHLGDVFTPKAPVPLDHPMVVARPDLFTHTPPNKPRPAATTKE